MKVLVLGGRGYLGKYLTKSLSYNGFSVFVQTREQLSNATEVISLNPFSLHEMKIAIRDLRPEIIINLIAETNVDECEMNPNSAYAANFKVSVILAQAISIINHNIKVIHISTDQVYSDSGCSDELSARPLNTYGWSKLAGEYPILLSQGLVLRANFVGRSLDACRRTFTDWLYFALQDGDSITVYDDVFINAMHINTLCSHIVHAIRHYKSGLFNVGTINTYSKAEFAFAFASSLGLDTSKMMRGSLMDRLNTASRPLDMRMNCTSFYSNFCVEQPTFEAELIKSVEDYNE